MFTGKLERELRDVHATALAKFRGGAGGGFDFLRFFEPGGEFSVRQKSSGERSGVHSPDAFRCEARQQLICKRRVLERVAVVGKYAVDVVFHMIEHRVERLHRIAGKPDGSDFTLLLEFQNRGNRLLPDLFQRHELHIMQQDHIEIIGAHPVQRDMHGLLNALCGEIEMRVRVAAELGA